MARKPTYEELENKIKVSEEQTAEYKQTELSLRRERDNVQKYLDVAGAIIVVIGANQQEW
jgi:hypothetical protein